MSYFVDEVIVPETLDGPGADDFRAFVTVRNTVEAGVVGNDVLTMQAHELLPAFRSNPQRARRLFTVSVDGAPVGRAMVTTRPLAAGAGADLVVDVLPAYRGRGIGAALLDHVEGIGRAAGAPALQSFVAHSVVAGGDRIASPTGYGDLPAGDPGVRFLRAHGFVLEQVARISVLELAGLEARLAELRAAAQAAAGHEYRLHTWQGPTPAEWLDELAVLRTRMSTDAPMAGMTVVPDPWDAERVVAHDDRHFAGGRTVLTTAVEHAPTGRLTGFSEIEIPSSGATAHQGDTLVLRDHRGHRLGMLLKAAVTQELLERAPQIDAVVTFNAEENRPMLDVNEALGFRPMGFEGAWQKRVEVAGE